MLAEPRGGCSGSQSAFLARLGASGNVCVNVSVKCIWTSLVAQMVKRLSTMQESLVPSLGREDPLEKEIATHSSILAWKIPWMEEPGRLLSVGSQRVGHN